MSARRDLQNTTSEEDEDTMMVERGPWGCNDDGGLSIPLEPSTIPGHVVGAIVGRSLGLSNGLPGRWHLFPDNVS